MDNMNEETYRPQPADLGGVGLPADLQPLMEELARNVHEVWAAARVAQGWIYGPQRDDERRRHPGLVPYDRLTEEEKDYDRNTAVETLRFILSRGFRIVRD